MYLSVNGVCDVPGQGSNVCRAGTDCTDCGDHHGTELCGDGIVNITLNEIDTSEIEKVNTNDRPGSKYIATQTSNTYAASVLGLVPGAGIGICE